MTMINERAVIPRSTLSQMAENWQEAEREIRQAYELLKSAGSRLKIVFTQDAWNFDFVVGIHSHDYKEVNDLLKIAKRDAWRAIINRMELRRIMSVKAWDEVEKQLESGEGMPDITAPNLIAMLEATFAKVHLYIEDAVKEVYDYLRPSPESWRFKEYKTNQKSQFELADKVILSSSLETWGNNFHVNTYREQMLRAIDNVFHALDGNGTVKDHQGPLVRGINSCPRSVGVGETDYFRFKCFKNCNLHLEFKRADLVVKLNQVAGGMALKP